MIDRQFSLILACNYYGYISGLEGNPFPWLEHPLADKEWFYKHTLNKIVVMGRKTFETLKSPLKDRLNIVLTKQEFPLKQEFENLIFIKDLCSLFCLFDTSSSFYSKILDYSQDEIMIIGGKEIYNIFFPFSSKIYLSLIRNHSEGSLKFNFNSLFSAEWKLSFKEKRLKNKASFFIFEKEFKPLFFS